MRSISLAQFSSSRAVCGKKEIHIPTLQYSTLHIKYWNYTGTIPRSGPWSHQNHPPQSRNPLLHSIDECFPYCLTRISTLRIRQSYSWIDNLNLSGITSSRSIGLYFCLCRYFAASLEFECVYLGSENWQVTRRF